MADYPQPNQSYGSHGSYGSGGYGSGGYGSHSAYGSGHGAYGSFGSNPFAAPAPSTFDPDMDPDIVACFQSADMDDSGFIDDRELQNSLSSYHQRFSLRTVHLLMYSTTSSSIRKIGPREFTTLVHRLRKWRSIFERFDQDGSGRIDSRELRDALLSLGFSVSPMILDLLVSKYDRSGGMSRAIEYDNFIEVCLMVKGLTERFKEKDVELNGSATMNYDTFMLIVLPYLVA